jgi:hypothetical protein
MPVRLPVMIVMMLLLLMAWKGSGVGWPCLETVAS